jgi:IPT/TIG domain-containing protein
MMRFAAFCLVSALAGSVLHADGELVAHVTPTEATTGSRVTVSGLGTTPVKPPRIVLTPTPDQPGLVAVRAKAVPPFAADALLVDIVKGLAGTYTMTVTPREKGAAPILVAEPFVIVPPRIDGIDPPSAHSGDTVTISGSFGARRGKLSIGGRRARVTSWSDAAIVALVPKHLDETSQTIEVANRSGATTATVTLDVTPPPPPEHGFYFVADVDGYGHMDLKPYQFAASYDPSRSALAIVGTTAPRSPSLTISFTIGNPDFERATPYTIGTTPSVSDPTFAIAQFIAGSVVSATAWSASSAYATSSVALTVTDWDGNFLTGTMTGTLVKPLDPSSTVTISSCAFRVRVKTR